MASKKVDTSEIVMGGKNDQRLTCIDAINKNGGHKCSQQLSDPIRYHLKKPNLKKTHLRHTGIITISQDVFPSKAIANVTAGFKCPPDTPADT